MPKKKSRQRNKRTQKLREKLEFAISYRLIGLARRFHVVPPPDIGEIAHYATCRGCRRDIEAQGWRVEFKSIKAGIYEVTFRHARYVKHLDALEERREREMGMYA